jgi:4-hydroxy-3-methylbut-2-enyl diphosphate reductase
MGKNTKEILVAFPRGFCAGVHRAVKTVSLLLERNKKVCVLGEIVHNKQVIDNFSKKGVRFISNISEKKADEIIVFPAHGISKCIKMNAHNYVDATCPLVQKVHNKAIYYAKKGYKIYLIGDKNHSEVMATKTYAKDKIIVINSADSVNYSNEKAVWLSQTTLNSDSVKEIVNGLKQKLPNLIDPHNDDICYATKNRQFAVYKLTQKSDFIIIVGSHNSSNTLRLLEIAKKYIPAVRVDSYNDLVKHKYIDSIIAGKYNKIGITSGASAPDNLIFEIIDKLKSFGYNKVNEINTGIKEYIEFTLPT